MKKLLFILILLGALLIYCLDSFVDCGCGCCGNQKSTAIGGFVLSPENFKDRRPSVDCALVGCSIGKKYYYINFGKLMGE